MNSIFSDSCRFKYGVPFEIGFKKEDSKFWKQMYDSKFWKQMYDSLEEKYKKQRE